jgi:hypothetical protein
MALSGSEVRDLSRGDKVVLAHLGIPDAVRLNIMDSSYWYYDTSSRKYTVHDAWHGVDASDLRI